MPAASFAPSTLVAGGPKQPRSVPPTPRKKKQQTGGAPAPVAPKTSAPVPNVYLGGAETAMPQYVGGL